MMKGLKFVITTDIKGSEGEIDKAIRERGRLTILEDSREMMEQLLKDEIGDFENVQVSVTFID
jgi:hypothetical protein